jgi:hypothetical protein
MLPLCCFPLVAQYDRDPLLIRPLLAVLATGTAVSLALAELSEIIPRGRLAV